MPPHGGKVALNSLADINAQFDVDVISIFKVHRNDQVGFAMERPNELNFSNLGNREDHSFTITFQNDVGCMML